MRPLDFVYIRQSLRPTRARPTRGAIIPRLVPIEDLVAQGYVLLREAGRDAVLAVGASP
jgi:hypothetical protein